LSRLRDEHVPLTILSKGYQSGMTVLIKFGSQALMLDKPRDWPAALSLIRVAFKDAAKLWTHFSVKVIAVQNDTLVTSFPEALFVLQRRDNFRVEVPPGSTVVFLHANEEITDAQIVNISIGGLLVALSKKCTIPQGATLKRVRCFFPGESGTPAGEPLLLEVNAADVVRIAPSDQPDRYCIGLCFRPNVRQEDEIQRYVRKRELDMLRKGF
jgi:c-di-GMP-binding flagellar brake protein YcgR